MGAMRNRTNWKPAGRARGFTLLEVMIVIVIILAIAGLVTWNLLGTKQEATKGTVQMQLSQIKTALNAFYITYDRFPTDEEGLAVLWDKTAMSEDDQGKWRAFMDEPLPKDTWGSAWGYKAQGDKAPSGKFDLWSWGPDRQDGTEDDINVWKQTADGGTSGGSSATPARSGSGTAMPPSAPPRK